MNQSIATMESQNIGDPELDELLGKARATLRVELEGNQKFLEVLSRKIGENYQRQHQVFRTEEGYVYGLLVCGDDVDSFRNPILISLIVGEGFFSTPEPNQADIGLFRRTAVGDPNNMIVPGAAISAPMPCTVNRVLVTRSSECRKNLSNFSTKAFLGETFTNRLGREILACFL